MNHTLTPDHLKILAELLALERGAALAAAHAVTPEGAQINLMSQARQARENNRKLAVIE